MDNPVLRIVLPAAAEDGLLLSSVLALSLIYKDRQVAKDTSTPTSVALLELRHSIIASTRQRLASKQYNDYTAFAIAHLIMIEVSFARTCNESVVADETSRLLWRNAMHVFKFMSMACKR